MKGALKVVLSSILIMASSLAHAQSVTLSPVSPHPETSVTVTGAHFADAEAIDVYVDTVDTLLLVSTATGTFSGTVTVPAAAAPGKHYITAIGRRSGDAAQAALTVTTPWVEFGYGAGHLGWNPYENTVSSDNVAQLGVLWSAPMSGTGGTPAVSSGKAFVGTYAGITALSTATGAVLWTKEASDTFYAAPAVVAGVVYAVGNSGTVYALAAATGAQIWSVQLGSESYSSPVVVAGVVYVADIAGTVYALQVSTGHIQWSTVLGGEIYSSPTVANGTLYIGCNDDNVYALNAETGAVEWTYTTGSAVGTPAVSAGIVYVGSDDDNVYAIRAANGTLLWSYNTGSAVDNTPAVAYGTVYIAGYDVLYALDAKFGTLIWSTTESIFGSAAVANGVVYAPSGASYFSTGNSLYALDPYYGEVLARWAIGADNSSPAISDGVVYMSAYGGSATALSLLAGTDVVRAEPRAPEISTLHPDFSLEVTQR